MSKCNETWTLRNKAGEAMRKEVVGPAHNGHDINLDVIDYQAFRLICEKLSATEHEMYLLKAQLGLKDES